MMEDLPVRVRLPPPRSESPPPAKARSASPAPKPTARPSAPGTAPPTIEDAIERGMDRALFEALCAHRTGLARVRSLPVYVIAPNRTLTEIAMLRPRCLDDLAMVHGMGPARIAAYGEGLLSVVREQGPPQGL